MALGSSSFPLQVNFHVFLHRHHLICNCCCSLVPIGNSLCYVSECPRACANQTLHRIGAHRSGLCANLQVTPDSKCREDAKRPIVCSPSPILVRAYMICCLSQQKPGMNPQLRTTTSKDLDPIHPCYQSLPPILLIMEENSMLARLASNCRLS